MKDIRKAKSDHDKIKEELKALKAKEPKDATEEAKKKQDVTLKEVAEKAAGAKLSRLISDSKYSAG
jgi:hypothetical protein